MMMNKIKILINSIEKIILNTTPANAPTTTSLSDADITKLDSKTTIENEKVHNNHNNDDSGSSDDNNNSSSEEDEDNDNDNIVEELLKPKQTIPELKAQKAVEEDRYIKEYYAVQLEKAKSYTIFENGRSKYSNPNDIFEVDNDGFMKLYRGKEKSYLKRLKKRHKIRMKEEAELRRKEREEMKRLEEIERERLDLEKDHVYQRYGAKPYIYDAEGISDCLGDLGETSIIFCSWFRDFMINECNELCCYYIFQKANQNDYDLSYHI